MLPFEHSAILLTCIKQIIGHEKQFLVFLRVAVLHMFYCIISRTIFDWLGRLLEMMSGLPDYYLRSYGPCAAKITTLMDKHMVGDKV